MTIQRSLEKTGLSSKQDARTVPVGTQLQGGLSAETGELVVSSMCDAEQGKSVQELLSFWERAILPSSCWESHESQREEVFYFDVLTFDIKCRKEKDLRLEVFFTFTCLKWGSLVWTFCLQSSHSSHWAQG